MIWLCGLGAYLVTQVIKTVSPWPVGSATKILVACVASVGCAALQTHHALDLGIYGLGGAGLAVVIHRVARLLTLAGDWAIVQIGRAASRNGRGS